MGDSNDDMDINIEPLAMRVFVGVGLKESAKDDMTHVTQVDVPEFEHEGEEGPKVLQNQKSKESAILMIKGKKMM